MIEIRRILCPIDFSDSSRRAFDHAVAVARWYQSTITALHVFAIAPVSDYAPGVAGPELVALTPKDRDQVLAEVKRFCEVGAAAGIPVETVVREGSTANEILGHATDMKADLLVMGTHGRSGFDRLLIGSVTEKVLRKARCPVLTVPRPQPDAVPAGPVLFKRIVCPIDFSDSSMQALRYATSLAKEADATLSVLHVLPHEIDATLEGDDAFLADEGLSLRDYRRRREEDAWRRTRDAVPATAGEYCSVETIVVKGKPSREILRVAAEQEADLIVIGVQGRGTIDLTFFGSTTNHVVRQAQCPVLTLCRG
jgi:nucleotide-binding universal stress UspA family protein